MDNSPVYYIMSTSPTFTSGYRAQVSPADNPNDKSTTFRLIKDKDGQIKLLINWWNGNMWKDVALPFFIDINQARARNVSEKDLQRFIDVNRAN